MQSSKSYCAKHRHLEGDLRGLAEARGGIDRVDFVAGEKDADPDQLGPYRIIRLLAYGGMGKVYEAEEKTLSRRVAVKTIRVGRAANPKLVEQFKAEREALALLHHTNIVPIFSAGEEDGLLYFAMPLINGLTLADLVETMSQPGSPRSGTAASATSPSSWADLLRLARTEASRRHTLQRLSARFGVRLSRASSPRPSSNPELPTPKRSSISTAAGLRTPRGRDRRRGGRSHPQRPRGGRPAPRREALEHPDRTRFENRPSCPCTRGSSILGSSMSSSPGTATTPPDRRTVSARRGDSVRRASWPPR